MIGHEALFADRYEQGVGAPVVQVMICGVELDGAKVGKEEIK